MFGVRRAPEARTVVLDTTGVSGSDVFDVSRARFLAYMADGLVPIGEASSTNRGQGEPQAALLGASHGAAIVVVEIRDPPPYDKEVETRVPTLMTESVWIDGTARFEGDVTRIGWAPGTTTIQVDPYFIDCRLWAERAWPPALGVYFSEEMRAFRGYADQPHWPVMKSAADRWRLSHPGEPQPPAGAEISVVLPDSPAEAIGLRWSDVLLSVDGTDIVDERTARQALAAAAGRRVELVVMRPTAVGIVASADQAPGWQISAPTSPLFQASPTRAWLKLTRTLPLSPQN
jgi:hypothetical protein